MTRTKKQFQKEKQKSGIKKDKDISKKNNAAPPIGQPPLAEQMPQRSDERNLKSLKLKLLHYATRMNYQPPQYLDTSSGSMWVCHVILNGIKYGAKDGWQSTKVEGTFTQTAAVEEALVTLNQMLLEDTVILKTRPEMCEKMQEMFQAQQLESLPCFSLLADVAISMKFNLPSYQHKQKGERWLSSVTVNGVTHKCDSAPSTGFVDISTADSAAAEKGLIELGAMRIQDAVYNQRKLHTDKYPWYDKQQRCWKMLFTEKLPECHKLPSDWHKHKGEGIEVLADQEDTWIVGGQAMEGYGEGLKSKLFEYCRSKCLPAPVFRAYTPKETPKSSQYIVTVTVANTCYTGLYFKRKRAILACAEQALVQLKIIPEDEVRIIKPTRDPKPIVVSDPETVAGCKRGLKDKVENEHITYNKFNDYDYHPTIFPRKGDKDLCEDFEITLNMKSWLSQQVTEGSPVFEYKHFTSSASGLSSDIFKCHLFSADQFLNESRSAISLEHAEHRAAHMELFLSHVIDIPPAGSHRVAKGNGKRMDTPRRICQVDGMSELSVAHPDYIGRLGTYALKNKLEIPIYQETEISVGNELGKSFSATVELNGVVHESLVHSHRALHARSAAAERALLALGQIHEHNVLYNLMPEQKAIKCEVWDCVAALLHRVVLNQVASAGKPRREANQSGHADHTNRDALSLLCNRLGFEMAELDTRRQGGAHSDGLYFTTVAVNDVEVVGPPRAWNKAANEAGYEEMLKKLKSMEPEIIQRRESGLYPLRDLQELLHHKNFVNIMKDDLSLYTYRNKIARPRYVLKKFPAIDRRQTTVLIGKHTFTSAMHQKVKASMADCCEKALIGLKLVQQGDGSSGEGVAKLSEAVSIESNSKRPRKQIEPIAPPSNLPCPLLVATGACTGGTECEYNHPGSFKQTQTKRKLESERQNPSEPPTKKPYASPVPVKMLSPSALPCPMASVDMDSVMGHLHSICVVNEIGAPFYSVESRNHDHICYHTAIVTVNGQNYEGATLRKKADAEKDAAECALIALGVLPRKVCYRNQKEKNKQRKRNNQKRKAGAPVATKSLPPPPPPPVLGHLVKDEARMQDSDVMEEDYYTSDANTTDPMQDNYNYQENNYQENYNYQENNYNYSHAWHEM